MKKIMSVAERDELLARCRAAYRVPVFPDTPPALDRVPGALNLEGSRGARREESDADKMFMMKLLR